MDFKDKNNKDDEKPELPPAEQPEESLKENKQTPAKSQIGPATTQSVAESLIRIRSQLEERGGQQRSSITLNVLGVDTPITFHDKQELTIGRRDPATNEHPDVNLNDLPLNTAGISRKHLKLVYVTGQWYAEDMGSRNGTWLNNKLLMAYQRYKLSDGDQLRVGSIIIIIMSHAPNAEDERPKSTSISALPNSLKLTTSAIIETQQGLSPSYIADLVPYLQAVIDMIQHVDRAKKRPQREISVVSIEFDHQTIVVHLSCSHEVLEFMYGQLFAMPIVKPIPQATEVMPTINSISELSVIVAEQSTEMARQFAEEYFPLITPDQSLYYQRLLVPLLSVCIESDIRVVI